MPIFVGLDPGTGISSPTGAVAFDSETKQMLFADTCGSQHDRPEHRFKEIAAKVKWLLACLPPEERVTVCIERFVMRGSGGETLARMTGALMAVVPNNYEIKLISNMTMKKVVGGSGKADKKMVAEGVLKYFDNSPIIKELILQKEWDLLDAFGLGICGLTNEK